MSIKKVHEKGFYLVLLFLCAFLSGCQTISNRASMTKHLPQPSQLECCWQKLESIVLHSSEEQGEVTNILAIIVREGQSLSVNLISPEGQQLMSLKQDGTNYSVNHFVEGLKLIPEYLILYGIYLSYSQTERWDQKETSWSVYSEPELRTLRYLRKDFLTLIDRSHDNSWTDRRISLVGENLVLDVSLIEHLSLPNK